MKSLRIASYVLVAAGLIGALWFLYSKTQSTDFARVNLIIADLRELEALDAEWTTDSLRAKTGINRQFAAGEAPSERVAKTSERIANAIRATGLSGVQAKFAAVNAVLAQKFAITKRFAEQNRILRESLLFVTDESADLLALLRVQQRDALLEKGGKGLQTVADLSELSVRFNELLTETLKYNLLSDPLALKRIESNLADVTTLLPKYPAYLATPIEALIIKFNGVQRIKAVEDSLLNDIATLPSRQRMADTEKALVANRQVLQNSTDFYRTLLIVYSAALLALIPLSCDRQRPAHAEHAGHRIVVQSAAGITQHCAYFAHWLF